ncbi:MAG: 4-alpha-glucanotransferase [Actinobacteria bacterium]|nr:4-alpha-glucanotransferase [Actinomycetota bacterium]
MIHDGWGVVAGYEDAHGRWTEVPESSRRSLIEAMGGEPEEAPPDPWDVWVVRHGAPEPLMGPVVLVLEDGTERHAEGLLPDDLPLGYHDLHPVRDGAVREDESTRLIVTPGGCYLPDDLHAWGVALQVYALRSASSWGVGDLADLATFGSWAAGLGADVALINPIDAPRPAERLDPSPYFPGTRRFRDPLYLRIEELEGVELLGDHLGALARAGRSLNGRRDIDRDAVLRLKGAALEALWARAGRRTFADEVEAFAAEVGPALDRFATYNALVERFGDDWHAWPGGYGVPDSPEVKAFAAEHADRVAFHRWVQWQLDRQLARAGASIGLMRDLPVGFDPGGFDAWDLGDSLAVGASVGAPPDELGPHGQDWQLPPFIPWRLRATRYQPWIETLRGALRHATALRIDHVLGLFRQFWIPPGATPAEGAYVRFPTREVLGVLALESHRAQAYIVGEDLGTVEAGVRDELATRRMLRYQVLWLDEDHPDHWAPDSLGALTTHDLPTLVGVWTGAESAAQRELGREPDEDFLARVRSRLADRAGLGPDAPLDEAILAAHRLLGGARSRVVVTQVEDLLGVTDRPNIPGTSLPRNWTLALPEPLEAITEDPAVTHRLSALGDARGGATPP